MPSITETNRSLPKTLFNGHKKYMILAILLLHSLWVKPQAASPELGIRYGVCGINDYMEYSNISEDKGFVVGLGVKQNFTLNNFLGLVGEMEWVWCSPVQKYGVFDSYYNFDVLTLKPDLIGINTEVKLRLRLDQILTKAELELLHEFKGFGNFLELGFFYNRFFVKSINASFEGKKVPENAYSDAAYGICMETTFEFNRNEDSPKNKVNGRSKKKKGYSGKKSKKQWNLFAKGQISTNLLFNDLHTTGNSGYFYTVSGGIRFKLGKK